MQYFSGSMGNSSVSQETLESNVTKNWVTETKNNMGQMYFQLKIL